MARLIKGEDLQEGELFNKWLYNRLIKSNKNILSAQTGPTGCSPKDSKVLMSNGVWKNIQDVKEGDKVISPQKDGSIKFSKVINTTKWFCNENYDVTQMNKTKKKLYSCSYNHIIPYLYRWIPRVKGIRYNENVRWDYKQCSAKKYSKFSKKLLSHQKIGFSSPLIKKFEGRKNCEVEPYTLGIILGDGSFSNKSLRIETPDLEVINEIKKTYPLMSVYNTSNSKSNSYNFSINSELSTLLKQYGLCNKKSGDKFIPKEAMLSDFEYRKRLLAGLIESDGYYAPKRGGYQFTQKSKRLVEDIRDLVYSLGGRCGEIRKVRKKIKSLGFEGTYYSLSFYLHDLKLPLKLERKKKDVNSIYLSSNRIAINVMKNNKKNLVYGFELEDESHWYVTDNWMVTHNSGKSYQDLRRAELWYQYQFNKPFPPENICFSVGALMKRLSSGELKRGEILIFEEAGANLGSLDFQTKISKVFTYVLQSFRSLNIGIFFNLPYLSMLNKQARMLIHVHAITAGIDEKKKVAKSKIFFLQVNQKSGKVYSKYLRAKVRGKTRTIKRFTYNLPSEELRKIYEVKKFKSVNDLTTSFSQKLDEIEKEENRKMERPELTQNQKEVLEDALMGLNIKQTAEKRGKSTSAIWKTREFIKKKGYSLEKEAKPLEKLSNQYSKPHQKAL